MKKLVIGCMALALLALVGVGAEAKFSPSLTPAAASAVDATFTLTNLTITQELDLTTRQYGQMSKKEQKQAKKNLLDDLEALLESAFGGNVTKKFAKSYFDALYGKPGQPSNPGGGGQGA